jgi:hypothetical protein
MKRYTDDRESCDIRVQQLQLPIKVGQVVNRSDPVQQTENC